MQEHIEKTAKGMAGRKPSPPSATADKLASIDSHSTRIPGSAGEAKEPDHNETPIPPQRSTDPKGTGHECAEGGLPEKQPITKQQ